MRRSRHAVTAAVIAALAAGPTWAQPADPTGPSDGGVAPAPDAGPLVVDGPELLGIARPVASAAAAPSRVRLGDTFTLFIDVVFDDQVTVNLAATLDLGDAFDEVKRTSTDQQRSDGTRKRSYQIQLRAWELGELRLPPFQVAYTVGGQRSWVVTNPVPIEVTGQLGDVDDKTAMLDDTPPVSLARRDWRWVMVAIAAVLVIAIALIARRLRRRRPLAPALIRAPTAGGRSARVRLGGPAERALAALDQLDRAGTLTREPRVGYDEMVTIMRTFVGEQFGVATLDRTSHELLVALGRTSIFRPALTAAGHWFGRCDLVKYAAQRPDAAGSGEDLASARAVIVGAAGGLAPAVVGPGEVAHG